MLKSLLARNIALLIITVLLAQLLTALLVGVLLIKPQTERLSQIMARNVAAISETMKVLPAAERGALIERINRGGAVRILAATAPPPQDRGIPTLLETMFVRAFATEMANTGAIVWRGGRSGQLWVRVTLGGAPYWVSYERPVGFTPFSGLALSISIAFVISLIAGILLQRRLGRPLRQLADAADVVGRGDFPDALPEAGPDEIAAVARSFNLMGKRLAAQEQDRAFMLAGISHDLRTPLAKIRLALAVQPTGDPEVEQMLERQLDRMDKMLGQFLDFARGADKEEAVMCDLAAAVRSALALVEVHPPISFAAATPVSARLYPLSFERALINLVRNAITYGAAPLKVALSIGHSWVDVSVADNGPGVPDLALAQLDQPFVRIDPARQSDGGTGLGLSIVKRVMAEHGGSLVLRNRTTGGFEAIMRLPKPAHEPQTALTLSTFTAR
jgi:two-component system, OmpR family, osmolarity sensor histidine kinase EnvZ